ncbi:MAG: magnesium/cobalt transporter CorA [Bacteroidales bacterium]|nr:magnesium/cobalt transporter CorA [Bacteroidales bacterium]
MKKLSPKTGLSPGSLVFVGHKKTDKTAIDIMDFNPTELKEFRTDNPEDLLPLKDNTEISWIDIKGVHNTELISQIGEHFQIHPLVLEDILNTRQRPKIDFYDDYIFAVMKMISWNDKNKSIETEQISLIIGQNYVLSFQEKEDDIFDPLRERIRKGKGRIRNMGSDYLAYAMLDITVDNYFLVLEGIGEHMELLEEKLLRNPDKDILKEIYVFKRENLLLRKAVWPLRELISQFERSDISLIKKKTRPFLRDLYDHTIQVIDTVETNRDMTAGLLELYLSTMSNKTNEVMKVLTIIATIFIPLTFIVGIYGMNFDNMPELQWPWAYFAVMGIMGLIAILMLWYFRRKKWL